MPDFQKQRRRSRIEARLLDAGAADGHATFGERKTEVIGSMSGTIVELGPGTGANMRYYAPGVKVIAIEPNPHMHERLSAQADRYGVDIEIRSLRGEWIDVADEAADGVVGTLLLCGVDDPATVIAEAHRVLKAGGVYFFIEHVRAPEGSRTRRVQQLVKRPHRWMFNGCRVDQHTAELLSSGPFDAVEIDDIDRGRSGVWVRHQIVGTATKAP
jgi:SAM-dependent methyltransferase